MKNWGNFKKGEKVVRIGTSKGSVKQGNTYVVKEIEVRKASNVPNLIIGNELFRGNLFRKVKKSK